MQQLFDFFGEPELPYMLLCNPNQEELYSLSLAYETKLVKKFNTLSEFTFIYPQSIDGGATVLPAYDLLKNKRLIEIEGFGFFQITNAEENLEGSVPLKSVECKSLESELIQKRITGYGGTKKLYDVISPEGTILQDMLDLAPTWSAGTISASLLVKYRTFNVSDTNIYNFLIVDVANAFECVFVFDTVNKEINIYDLADATTETDIFLSFDNIISKANFSEKSDEITTALAVYGSGNLNIRLVNPLGTDIIYNFNYYKTTDWMSQGLVDAVTAWEALIASKQTEYADDLTLLSTYNSDLLVLQATLATLEADYLSIQGVQKSRIQQNIPYSDITALLVAKQVEIDAQNVLITNKNTQIATVTSQLNTIHTQVSFDSNFTSPQLLELNSFIYENTYKNDNIIQTDIMTLVEIQSQAQALYDQGMNVLGRVSQPRYEVGLESVNYTVLEDFSIFTNQTDVGCIVTCELSDGAFIETALLELSMQFDDPSAFSMTFSNRLRLDNGNFTYSDLIGQVVKTGSAVSFDSVKWANWENLYKNDVTSFIDSSLNATTNNLVSNSNQEILINQNGLRAKQSTGVGTYSPKEAWLVNNTLAFSTDGFQTSKLALGEITLPGGGTGYGLVADYLIGRMIAGNTLTIANDSNNFVLDQTGATLNNAKFSIQTTNAKILLDPLNTRSFRIQQNVGGTFTDKFWVDNAGNVNFAGTLTGATGVFSGTISATVGNIGTLVIDSLGLKTADGVNYLRGNGDLKWGGLTISGSSASFSGDIFANKLVGAVSYTQLTDIPANKITSGTMSGSRVFGGSIGFSTGTIQASGSLLTMYSGGVGFGTGGGGVLLNGGTIYSIGSGHHMECALYIENTVYADGNPGITQSKTLSTPYGSISLTFRRGICISMS